MRDIARAPMQFLLSVVGVALGVAAVVAVDLANHSAKESFLAASDAISAASTHAIQGEIDDGLYRSIRLSTPHPVQPLVQGRVRIVGSARRSATVYGVDPIASFEFEEHLGSSASVAISRLIAEPLSALASGETLRQLGVRVGDSISIEYAGAVHEVVIIGALEPKDIVQRQSLQSLLLMDIASAQSVLGMRGKLSSIQLSLPSTDESIEALEQLLPQGAWLQSTELRRQALASIIQSFQTNLTAMSLLAILVAALLIYNTMTFLAMRRKSRIITLRALGATRRAIAGCFALEALCIGIFATLIGFAFGTLLSERLLYLVERSISALYAPISTSSLAISAQATVVALALGLGATLLSALPALLQVYGIKSSIGGSRQSGMKRLSRGRSPFMLCALLAASGMVVMQLDSRSLMSGFASIYLVVAGYLCLVPMLCANLSKLLRGVSFALFGVRGILASRAFAMTGGRTSAAVCALCMAISATIGVGVMISSFRTAVDAWLVDRLTADLYVTTQSEYGGHLDEAQVERLRLLPGVDSIGVANWTWLNGPEGRSRVVALDYGESNFGGYRFVERMPGLLWNRFQTEGVIISQPFAWRHDIGVGDSMTFYAGQTVVEMPVLGVFYDYSSDQGIVSMHLDVFRANFNDGAITAVAIFAADGVDVKELSNAVAEAVNSPWVSVFSAGALREASLKVFDQTFAITAVLRSLAIVVAFIAVVSVLAMIQIDREHELRIQNAIGFTRRQIWASASAETAMMGFFAGILSIPLA